MTKKDYILIAAAIRRARNANPNDHAVARDTLEHVAREIADDLKRDNGRFDRARFLAACIAPVTGE